MQPFSIVIVAKDSADKIGRLLSSIQGLSDDVIVCDTGSSDDTIGISARAGARVYSIPWQGYGRSKNAAIGFAKHDWILSLDSDEKVDETLYRQLQQWTPVNEHTVHQVLWKNFFSDQWIRHSDWGSSWKNRLFHKYTVHWDDAIAHEDVTSEQKLQFVQFNGYLEHYTFKDTREYASKMVHSAMITAQKYHEKGKKASVLKLVFSPLYSFFKAYVLKLGFLDGYKGWLIAVTTGYYTFIKYVRLRELNRQ
ncbi:MAG: glycosyltransferase family 2 protein [Chitinophagaceae bacterium]